MPVGGERGKVQRQGRGCRKEKRQGKRRRSRKAKGVAGG